MMNDETFIRIMIYEIRERNPEVVKFVPTTQDVKSILLCMQTRKYDTIMYMYGYKFLLEILKLYEESENYEECLQIVEQIKKHNGLINDKIPTK
jgi:transcription elongation factor GreA-like protein